MEAQKETTIHKALCKKKLFTVHPGMYGGKRNAATPTYKSKLSTNTGSSDDHEAECSKHTNNYCSRQYRTCFTVFTHVLRLATNYSTR